MRLTVILCLTERRVLSVSVKLLAGFGKGKKMAGQMGNERSTTQSLKVVRVDIENNLLLIKGAVPGATGSQLIVRPATKAKG